MKKQLTLILSLIVLVGIAVGILLFVNNMESNNAAEEERIAQEKVLVSVQSNDINKIDIKTQDAEYNAVLNDEGKWELENEVDFEINTYYLNSMASQLSSLTADDIICPVAEADLASYGLDSPSTVITLHENGNTHTINVGKLSATQEFYYVTMEGRDNVYAVSKDYADYITANKNSLKSIYILRNSDSEICRISLEAHGELVYELERNSKSFWEMKQPLQISDRIDNTAVSSLTTQIRQMIVDKFGDEYVTEEQYAEYGFDSPEYVFTFEQDNGETTTLLAQDYPIDDTSFVCLICKETGQIFYMESTYTSFLQDKPEEFILEHIYTSSFTNTESVSIRWEERSNAEITIDDENGNYTFNGVVLEDKGKEMVETLEDFFDKIQGIRYDTFVIDCPVDESAEPEIVITYRLTDGTETVISFIVSDSENYAVFVNGEYSHFTVSKKNFTAREGIYDYYDQLLDEADIE